VRLPAALVPWIQSIPAKQKHPVENMVIRFPWCNKVNHLTENWWLSGITHNQANFFCLPGSEDPLIRALLEVSVE
jgi:hypothetical protein